MSREEFELLFVGKILRWVGIVFFFIICAFPLYYMILLSFKSMQSLLTDPGNLLPDWGTMWPPTAYIQVLKPRAQGGQGFLLFIRNSALVSLAATAITLAVCIVAAYAATRLRFRGKGEQRAGVEPGRQKHANADVRDQMISNRLAQRIRQDSARFTR